MNSIEPTGPLQVTIIAIKKPAFMDLSEDAWDYFSHSTNRLC